MMLPSIFGENLLDNWFDDGWNSWDYSNTSLMNTDIKENDNDYELTMNLPGVKKEDVTAELKDARRLLKYPPTLAFNTGW